MSVVIETVTISSIADKRLLLGNAQWAATISAGTSWTRLRVAARMALDDTGADLTGTPRLYVGMCSSPAVGLTNGPLNAACDHFIGFISDSATVSRLTGPPVHYSIGGQVIGKKVGSTITLAGISTGHRVSAAPTTVRQVTMVEIEKGSPNFTIRCGLLGGAPSDISETLLISALESSAIAGGNSILSQANHSGTIAIDEAVDGFFNALCIGWDRSSSKLHVSEMYYAIYS